jgi:hypothetical protein
MKKELYGENAVHSEIADSLESLATNYSRFGDDNKSLEYGIKCFEMRKELYGENAVH